MSRLERQASLLRRCCGIVLSGELELVRKRLGFVDEPAESELLEQRGQPGDIDSADLHRVPVDMQIEMLIERDQRAAETREIGELFEVRFEFFTGDFVGIQQHFIERSELLEQRGRFFGTDQRHSRYVVDAVADQRLEVDGLVRPDPPVRLQIGLVNPGVLADVENPHARTEQLASILVVGDDADVEPSLDRLPSQCCDDVVRFPAVATQLRDAEAVHDLLHHLDLRPQVFGHLGAIGFVFGIQRLAGSRSRRVHRAQPMCRPLSLQNVEQVACEAEDRVRRQTLGAGHRGDRVEHLKQQRKGVDQEERGIGHW